MYNPAKVFDWSEIPFVCRGNDMILTDALSGLLAGVVVVLVVSAFLKWKKKKD